jgi:DNA (cytosine-5)-methyltransferase 1
MPIPIIDLFAGPGGLGEGFSALNTNRQRSFQIKISIEKDVSAYKTLSLRAVYRYLKDVKCLDPDYDYVKGKISESNFRSHPLVKEAFNEVQQEALCLELGKSSSTFIDSKIKKALDGNSKWVLIGGPPCQAYSLAGRSRRSKEEKTKFETDERHFLYREYLRIIREHSPAIFVMENVKGILSSTISGQPIFSQILKDLSKPSDSQEYVIRSLVVDRGDELPEGKDFIIQSELFGIPQSRHRVILLGIRRDVYSKSTTFLNTPEQTLLRPAQSFTTVSDAISDLPRLRSGISRGLDDSATWLEILQATPSLLGNDRPSLYSDIKNEMLKALTLATNINSRGGQFISKPSEKTGTPKVYRSWIEDKFLEGALQHQTRSHMAQDIQRYFYLSCYSKVISGHVPKVQDLPLRLLPNHKNITHETPPNQDRFRVQLAEHPGKTVTSHISKDGHYFIHYDPTQSRSFTLREAARIQSFPDNYYFEGGATASLHQVGNAVPPLLANQIASIVERILAT